MTNTRDAVIGVFEDEAEARAVVDELVSNGFDRADIHMGSAADYATDVAAGGAALTGRPPAEHHSGFMGWLRSLFGGHDDGSRYSSAYEDAVRRGGCVVAVDTDAVAGADRRDRAIDIMNNHGAVDIEQNAGDNEAIDDDVTDTDAFNKDTQSTSRAYGTESARDYDTTSVDRNEKASIPVVEEELRIGKRVVQRGGVRVYSHVIEEPVEEEVTLREERVHVDRRPADRAISGTEAGKLRDQTIEVTTQSEEPVIEKQARVVEEVVVGKDSTERKETIKDKVRRTKVETEPIGDTSDVDIDNRNRNR